MHALTPFFLIATLSFYALFSMAQDQIVEEGAASPQEGRIKILSWNLSQVGTEKFEYDRIAKIMFQADLIVLQNVEFSPSGETPLTVITSLMSKFENERICKAWFKSTTGERAGHAFVWKDRLLSFVEQSGEVKEECTEAPHLLRAAAKKFRANEFRANFLLKNNRRLFTVASVQLAGPGKKNKSKSKIKVNSKNKKKNKMKSQKSSDDEAMIKELFSSLQVSEWPTLVAGDFGISSKSRWFKEAKALGFKPLLSGVGSKKPSFANFWLKGGTVLFAESVDLHESFHEMSPESIDQTVSEQSPLLVDLALTQDKEILKMQIIKRPKRDKASRKSVSAMPAPTRPTPLLPLNVHDDLESEARALDVNLEEAK